MKRENEILRKEVYDPAKQITDMTEESMRFTITEATFKGDSNRLNFIQVSKYNIAEVYDLILQCKLLGLHEWCVFEAQLDMVKPHLQLGLKLSAFDMVLMVLP